MVAGYQVELSVKAFVIYTGLRLALFVVCYVVLGGLYLLVVRPDRGAGVALHRGGRRVLAAVAEVPRPAAGAFAPSSDARAHEAAASFEERKAREDVD